MSPNKASACAGEATDGQASKRPAAAAAEAASGKPAASPGGLPKSPKGITKSPGGPKQPRLAELPHPGEEFARLAEQIAQPSLCGDEVGQAGFAAGFRV